MIIIHTWKMRNHIKEKTKKPVKIKLIENNKKKRKLKLTKWKRILIENIIKRLLFIRWKFYGDGGKVFI